MRPRVRRTRGDDRAVSSVLGAILLFGLFVVTLVVIQTQFVPVWDEDREARHMQVVSNQMSSMVSDLGRVAANESRASITDPLTLSASEGGFRFFQRASPSGFGNGATFTPSATGGGLNVTATNLRLLLHNGQDLFGLGEEWITIPVATQTVSNIVRVDHLRVRVDMFPANYNDGDSATLTVAGPGGAFAGKAVVTFRDFPSEQALETKVYNAQNQEISSDVEAFFQQTHVDYFYIDLLNPGLLFRTVLAATPTPFSLGLVRNGLNASYTLAATTVGGGQTGVGGLVIPSYALEVPAGKLAFNANNAEFPSQTLVIENGALLVVQPDGVAMRVPPAMAVAATNQQATLSWTVPNLSGDAAGLIGATTASVVLTPTGARNEILGIAPGITLRIPTAYPAVWQAYLDDLMRNAGLSTASGQYTLTPAAGSVTLNLIGPNSDSATEDVVLALQQSTIRLDVRPTG